MARLGEAVERAWKSITADKLDQLKVFRKIARLL